MGNFLKIGVCWPFSLAAFVFATRASFAAVHPVGLLTGPVWWDPVIICATEVALSALQLALAVAVLLVSDFCTVWEYNAHTV